MATKSHSLGIGHGSIVEDLKRGTIQYRASCTLLPAFTVRLADVTGVSGQKKGLLHYEMLIHGQGTILAKAKVNHGTTERVEKWFKSRIGLGAVRTAATHAPSTNSSFVDELAKLGDLKEKGLLSNEEFLAAKKKLIG